MRGPLDLATRVLFRAGATLRQARAFHPRGVAYRAAATIEGPDVPAGLPDGSFTAIVRFSRGAGLPDLVPDVHGIALKLIDACGDGCDQDLLLASAGAAPFVRHLLRPTRSFGAGVHSSILPYDTGGTRSVIGARVAGPTNVRLGDLDQLIEAGRCRIDLLTSSPTGGWLPIGHVDPAPGRLSDDVEQALSFDPWHTAATFVPAGVLNRLRRPAYNASRQGRPFGFDHEPEPGKP